MDITQPLQCGRIISLGKNKEQRVFLKYERLPNLYYWCGYLTHSDKNYDVWLDSEGTLTVEQQTYGSWIWEPVFSKAQRNMITMPGFYVRKGCSPQAVAETQATAASKVLKPNLPMLGNLDPS